MRLDINYCQLCYALHSNNTKENDYQLNNHNKYKVNGGFSFKNVYQINQGQNKKNIGLRNDNIINKILEQNL